jgi:hypothetical protein
MTDSEQLTLRQATEAGMFSTLAAARKAVHRARLTPVGYHYAAALYEVTALATCQPRKVVPMPQQATWKPIPGYPFYEASIEGEIRSVDHTDNLGRAVAGGGLRSRTSNRNYQLVNVTDAEGRRQTRTVHSLVLAAHVGPPPKGQVTRHLNDNPADNRLANLAYGTPAENEQDKFANGTRKPAEPKPERRCVRCQAVLEPGRGGKRCHACVTEIGEQAAGLLRGGVTLEEVGKRLEYPHLSGLHQLARTYGGYGLSPQPATPLPSQTATASRGVLATLRDRLRRRPR